MGLPVEYFTIWLLPAARLLRWSPGQRSMASLVSSATAGVARRFLRLLKEEGVSCGTVRDDMLWKFNDVFMAPQGHGTGAASQKDTCGNSNLERQGCSPFYQELVEDPYVDLVSASSHTLKLHLKGIYFSSMVEGMVSAQYLKANMTKLNLKDR